MHFTNHVYLNSSAVCLALSGKALENWTHQLFWKKKNPRLCEASSLPEGGGGRRCPPSFPPRSLLSAPSRRPLGGHLTSRVWSPIGLVHGLWGCVWGEGVRTFVSRERRWWEQVETRFVSLHLRGQVSVLCRDTGSSSAPLSDARFSQVPHASLLFGDYRGRAYGLAVAAPLFYHSALGTSSEVF